MQPHATPEKVKVAPIAEMQQRQAIAQRRIGLRELVCMLVNAREIIKRVETALRVLLIRQLRKECRRAIRKASLEEQLSHLARQREIRRSQRGRFFPRRGRIRVFAAAER